MKQIDQDPPERKSVTMPKSMWRDVQKFQKSERIGSEAEALRRLLMAGIRVIERSGYER